MNVQVTNVELRQKHAELSKLIPAAVRHERGKVIEQELEEPGQREINLDF